jgi:hypothetical protein
VSDTKPEKLGKIEVDDLNHSYSDSSSSERSIEEEIIDEIDESEQQKQPRQLKSTNSLDKFNSSSKAIDDSWDVDSDEETIDELIKKHLDEEEQTH